jgi:glucokinase
VSNVQVGIPTIKSVLRRLLTESGTRLQGIGIGCTGRVDPLSGVLGKNDFLPDWGGANLYQAFADWEVTVAAENDADAASLAEASWGTGIGRSRLIYVTVSTGIGGGIVLNGELYRGVDGAHPEIGHHVLDANGPPCFCGANGCWESLASGTAMARWVQSHHSGEFARQTVDAALVCRLAEQGHLLALEAVERESYYLGLGLGNLITLFAPEMIVLGGGVMKSWNLFADRTHQTIEKMCRLVPHDKTHIAPASLGPSTGLIGAARVWVHRFG